MKKNIVKSTVRNAIDGILVFLLFITTTVYALPSNGVTYDNTNSGSSATTVNEALDDLYTKVNDKQSEIDRINGIGDASASHILSGKKAYVKGQTITGTIPSKGAATYTPGTSNQTIAAGNYLSGAQTIKGDANLVAGNIAKGKTIFGVAGSYTSDANAAAKYIVKGKTAYVNGVKLTGTLPNRSAVSGGADGVVGLDSTTYPHVAVSPFDGAIHWKENTDGVKRLCLQVPYGVYGGAGNPGGLNGDGYVGVEVSKFGTAETNQVLNTATFTSQNGMNMKGTIPSKGAATYTPGKSNQTIAAGNYLSGVQTIKGDANLVAGNIAKGKTIFGVAGTYTSDANAAAGNILNGKTAYVNGSKITGTYKSLENAINFLNSTGVWGAYGQKIYTASVGQPLTITTTACPANYMYTDEYSTKLQKHNAAFRSAIDVSSYVDSSIVSSYSLSTGNKATVTLNKVGFAIIITRGCDKTGNPNLYQMSYALVIAV